MGSKVVGTLLSLLFFAAVTGDCTSSFPSGEAERESQILACVDALTFFTLPERGRPTTALGGGERALRSSVKRIRSQDLQKRFETVARRNEPASDPPAFHRKHLIRVAGRRSDSLLPH